MSEAKTPPKHEVRISEYGNTKVERRVFLSSRAFVEFCKTLPAEILHKKVTGPNGKQFMAELNAALKSIQGETK